MWSPGPVGGSLLTAVLLCLSAVPLTANCPKPDGRENVLLTQKNLLKNEFPEGSTATFECVIGYVKTGGKSSISCTGGTWTNLTLQCGKKECGSPGDILNGRFNFSQGIEFGAIVHAICNEGFEIVGSAYRQCYADGWSGRVPVCEVVKCDQPPEIQNGRIIAGSNKDLPVYQDIIQYECDKDYYILIGKSTISCNSRGEYEPAPPVCEAQCPAPEARTDVILDIRDRYTKYFSSGSTVTFECDIGLETKGGSPHVTCQNGIWTNLTLECQKKLCVPPGQVENGRIVFSKGVEYGSTATVTCNEGYKVVGIKSVYCSFDGWSNQLGTCEAPCPRPDAQENVVLIREDLLKNEFRDGTTATFECVAGYVRSTGVPTITCTGGKWTELSLKCQKKSCGSPGDPQNGRFDLSQGTEVGAVAKLICNDGFTAVGPGLIHCSDEGWSGQPTCEELMTVATTVTAMTETSTAVLKEIPLQRTYTTPLIVAMVGVLVACILLSYYYWQKKNGVYYTREEDQKPVGVLCLKDYQLAAVPSCPPID